jgi:hypothetical protein
VLGLARRAASRVCPGQRTWELRPLVPVRRLLPFYSGVTVRGFCKYVGGWSLQSKRPKLAALLRGMLAPGGQACHAGEKTTRTGRLAMA